MMPFLAARRRRTRPRLHHRQARRTHAPPPRPKRPKPPPRPTPRTNRSQAALKIDDLKVELGYALLPLVNAPDGTDRLTEQIKALRRSLAVEMGFVMPAGAHSRQRAARRQHLRDQRSRKSRPAAASVWPGQYMVMDPAGGQVKLPGIHTTEPTFGLPGNLDRRRAQGRSSR